MWYRPENEASVFTPAVLVFPDRIEENIRRMIDLAGDVQRLRPHVKTHKIAEVISLQVQMGITRFKCATLSEVEMVAANGGLDVLLAYPLLGPAIQNFLQLMEHYPETKFSVTVDSMAACRQLLNQARIMKKVVNLYVDLDNGMHRTGIEPEKAVELIEFILEDPSLRFAGLHIYDGHIHDVDFEERKAHCDADFASVTSLVSELEGKGIAVGELACGGTPTFSVHVLYESRTLCPGTPVLWDAGYGETLPDLDFLPAAVVAGRVISKPVNQICLDLGYKSLASEMTHPRLRFLNLEHEGVLNHSEEHLVVCSSKAREVSVGDLVYALPTHVCPTMALHEQVYVVQEQLVVDTWKVVARKRVYKP
ncbi:MAG: D-TA family PLP-dependent enzyme [Bacteroidales bacterium]|nr:D-TA family PLP-dependent enzyme [Bacteroidales bacterium]